MSTPTPTVAPTLEDPVVRAGSEVVGGPAGRRRAFASSWWTPIRVLLVFAFLAGGLAVVGKAHCYRTGWLEPDPDKYVHQCYSDIPLLYFGRGLDQGNIPYLDDVADDQQVEYPVLTGVVMGATAEVTRAIVGDQPEVRDSARWYFAVNVLLLFLCFLGVVVATARTVRSRPWDAAIVALSPGIILAGTINWDLWAVLGTSGALLAWARKRPVLAGVLLGLATAAKFYPLLILGPLLLLCWRAGRLRAGLAVFGAATAAWLVVNVPVMVLAFPEWSRFYTFSQNRPAGFGSIWYVGQLQGTPILGDAERLNPTAGLLFVASCAAIALIVLLARRRPRLAQVAFMVVAAFLLTNKVYSPQFVVWLVPLAALARPRWRDNLIWQVCEAVHFFATWLYLVGQTSDQANRALGADGYSVAVLVHVLGTLWLMGVVIRDIFEPEHDPVRAGGADDPGGGVLDEAPDRWELTPPLRRPVEGQVEAPPVPVGTG